MDDERAARRLEALAHPDRLAMFRMLTRSGEEGLPASTLANRLQTAASTVARHLARLTTVGLVTADRRGATTVFRTAMAACDELLAHLAGGGSSSAGGRANTEPGTIMATRLLLSPVTGDEILLLAAVLAGSGLPADDLSEPCRIFFAAREETGRLAAFGGIEGEGPDVLLRSIVVDKECRRRGLGAELVRGLEVQAAAQGVRRLWLLTATAERFFARLGYIVVDRSDAPATIRGSRQFSSLCPSTATLMVRTLD